ncbi:hypothetical protein Kpol_495p11 [Vanderwaltozyma polyspora DSM 70294]|uniref:Uncharacterized protein n=1 Tax=Vanderwaltozyma polyspora (strain ATCC 22028 / DSM 70294 / BCRC 21397 / CBS 2163 / NBRC 10782 / NRRL Y-8283 / UCD 57-17) TaxID=436907 RepID=A7TNY8_VANPO|nr:uncharacterized protein Kpol_495p11 [Vanderwaltozyma polyspora DSM 70294]EDO16013.1 hypothetical protein Kpol_495p11 [Vanderwaltozyma polyspora DSM 70294]
MSDNSKRSNRKGKGLATETNPLLLSSNLNLVKEQHRNVNPYLSTNNQSPNSSYRKVHERYRKGLKFFQKGEISAKYELERKVKADEEARQQEEDERKRIKEEEEQEILKVKVANGELPDFSTGENKYLKDLTNIPTVEWWDKPYLDDRLEIFDKYRVPCREGDNTDEEEEEDEDFDENMKPSIRYVLHPIPIKVDEVVPVSKVYLTKTEIKKARRNRRKIEREELETKIKLGVLPKPAPKVKLANMMSVYENNQNITDPTSWEKTVRNQVEERKRKHEDMNLQRHEEAMKLKKSKMQEVSNVDNTKGNNFCKVYWFKSMSNPKIRFKINTNGKQLDLKGFCIRIGNEGPGLIVSSGDEKSIKFFDKLITRRIKWDESYKDKIQDKEITIEGNNAIKLWEGNMNNDKFRRFFMKVCENADQFKKTLEEFDCEYLYSMFYNH